MAGLKVALTRRVSFSAGHRYWDPDCTEAENRAQFGRFASPFNHGHNYVLELTCTGTVDPVNGMVVNIKRVDDLLKERVLSPLDGKSLNDEVSFFKTRSPSLENLLAYFRTVLADSEGNLEVPSGLRDSVQVEITNFRLFEMPTLWADSSPQNPMITLTRSYEFAASHRLHSPALGQDENISLYGKCNHANGHGHNYVLEVSVVGQPSSRTGMVVNIDELDQVVSREILDRYDHRNLDLDIPELAGTVTTSENVVAAIYQRLQGKVPGTLAKVKLYETARNAFEISSHLAYTQ